MHMRVRLLAQCFSGREHFDRLLPLPMQAASPTVRQSYRSIYHRPAPGASRIGWTFTYR